MVTGTHNVAAAEFNRQNQNNFGKPESTHPVQSSEFIRAPVVRLLLTYTVLVLHVCVALESANPTQFQERARRPASSAHHAAAQCGVAAAGLSPPSFATYDGVVAPDAAPDSHMQVPY